MGSALRVCIFRSLVRYGYTETLQEQLSSLVKHSDHPDALLVLQHAPVYTIGKRGKDSDFLVPKEVLFESGVEIVTVPRGGETTFHGPGQLVAYPIVNLRRRHLGARAYVEALEDSIVRTVGAYGLQARGRVPGRTGVWIGERKIAAIGVRIAHGVSSHGLALNVATDLQFFNNIVPCGIADKAVTSISKELQHSTPGSPGTPQYEEVLNTFIYTFKRTFQYSSLTFVDDEQLVNP